MTYDGRWPEIINKYFYGRAQPYGCFWPCVYSQQGQESIALFCVCGVCLVTVTATCQRGARPAFVLGGRQAPGFSRILTKATLVLER